MNNLLGVNALGLSLRKLQNVNVRLCKFSFLVTCSAVFQSSLRGHALFAFHVCTTLHSAGILSTLSRHSGGTLIKSLCGNTLTSSHSAGTHSHQVTLRKHTHIKLLCGNTLTSSHSAGHTHIKSHCGTHSHQVTLREHTHIKSLCGMGNSQNIVHHLPQMSVNQLDGLVVVGVLWNALFCQRSSSVKCAADPISNGLL